MDNPCDETPTLEKRLFRLESIYLDVERDQAAFRDVSATAGTPVGCPPRCGVCCVHFTPDVLPVEADRVAFHLLSERPELGERFAATVRGEPRDSPACPFWDETKPGENCSIYPARPLICRLFAFCSTRSKHGEPEFALCSDMPDIPGLAARRWTGEAELLRSLGAVPPPMVTYAAQVASIDPTHSGERRLLTEALAESANRVGLGLALAKRDEALYR